MNTMWNVQIADDENENHGDVDVVACHDGIVLPMLHSLGHTSLIV